MENKDIFSTNSLIDNIGLPFILGMAVGYFAKKMLSMLLFLSGGAVVLLIVADYNGVVHISNDQLLQATGVAVDLAKNSSDFLLTRLSQFTAKGVSATGGFLIGFKRG